MSNIIKTFDSTAISFNDDGWFNATEAARKYGKEPNEWVRLPSTTEYVGFLGKAKCDLVRTARGHTGGTWLHPDLLPHFIRWCSPSAEARIDGVFSMNSAALRDLLRAFESFEIPDDVPDMFVYAMRNTVTGNVKLGISRDPEKRLKQLQTGNDCRLELLAMRRAVNRFSDERAMHAENADHRIQGEWFKPQASISFSSK